MKPVILLLLVLIAANSFGQDTLFYKDGNVKAVQIIEMDKLAKLVGYISEGDTIYAAISSFDRVVYAGRVSSSNGISKTAVIIDTEKAKDAVRSNVKLNPKYLYGKWAVSTNLTSCFENGGNFVFATNRVFSVEPEYFVHDRFSIKMPIHLGLEGDEVSRDYYGNTNYRMNDLNGDVLPTVRYLESGRRYRTLGHKRDLLFQIGINPKYYFKGQRNFSWYFSQGFYISRINLNRADYYYTYEKYTNNMGDFYWERPNIVAESFDEKRWGFRYEGAIGLAINVTKNLGLTTEFGYTTVIKSENEGFDRVFIREGEGEYVSDPFVVQHKVSYPSGQFLLPYFRVHLVYRFGGVKNVVK
jgi:hypothetical protein